MSIFIRYDDLVNDLRTAFAETGSAPILIHSDMLKIGLVEKRKPRVQMCQDYERAILSVLDNRTLLFPTFNYDFCRDGRFDRQGSVGQVGVLSDYFRSSFPNNRTRTPVFNFCIVKNKGFNLEEVQNPFGTTSSFGTLHRNGGFVAFLGAPFESNTMIHYVEEQCDIGYRYIKQFTGSIIDKGIENAAVLNYRVRPMVEGAAEYDWELFTKELTDIGILRRFAVGNGELLIYRTTEFVDFVRQRIQSNELYLLTKRSRQIAEQLYSKHGSKLTCDALEGTSNTASID